MTFTFYALKQQQQMLFFVSMKNNKLRFTQKFYVTNKNDEDPPFIWTLLVAKLGANC